MQPCRRPAKVLPLRPVLDAPQHGAGIDEVTEVEGGFEQRVKPARSVEDAGTDVQTRSLRAFGDQCEDPSEARLRERRKGVALRVQHNVAARLAFLDQVVDGPVGTVGR